jgi:hypothetical protein
MWRKALGSCFEKNFKPFREFSLSTTDSLLGVFIPKKEPDY